MRIFLAAIIRPTFLTSQRSLIDDSVSIAPALREVGLSPLPPPAALDALFRAQCAQAEALVEARQGAAAIRLGTSNASIRRVVPLPVPVPESHNGHARSV